MCAQDATDPLGSGLPDRLRSGLPDWLGSGPPDLPRPGPPNLLRPGLLEGIVALVASAPAPRGPRLARALGDEVCEVCAGLGARVSRCRPLPDRPAPGDARLELDDAALDAAVGAVVGEAGRIDLLAVDGAGLFAAGLARGGGGHAALRACMDAAWSATRAVVNGAFLARAPRGAAGPAGEGAVDTAGGEARGVAAPRAPAGRIVYLAPAPDADRSEIGQHAEAARAGLENLARTLSIEWARHGINTVTIAPGVDTTAGEVAALSAYLGSPAGAYFSGCLLDLRGP